MKNFKKSIGALAFLGFSVAQASEVDNIFSIKEFKIDAEPFIQAQSELEFAAAIEEANRGSKTCQEDKLYEKLRARFGNHIFGTFTKKIIHSSDFTNIQTEFETSIYKDFTKEESFVLARLGAKMGKTILWNKYIIGTDKFEHFWSTGFRYYKKAYLEKEGSIQKAFEYGESRERGILGVKMTGIYSYGDLSANFNGMRFWNHLLARHPDPLGDEYMMGPYVKCDESEHKWIVVEFPKWKNYFDASFSEGLNLPKFKTEAMVVKVKNEVEKRKKEKSIHFISGSDWMSPLKLKYGEYWPRLLNDEYGVAPGYEVNQDSIDSEK